MNELAQHMVDTVKEWQCKIGVRKEKMDLFYPLESLKELLQLDPAASTEELEKILTGITLYDLEKEYQTYVDYGQDMYYI